MKKIKLTTLLLLTLLFSFSILNATDVKPDDIIGTWLIEEDDKPIEKIEIYKTNDLFFGKIVWMYQEDSTASPLLDIKNGKKELKNRQLLGLEILKNYKFDGKKTWKDGKLYAHRKGRTVSPKLTLIDYNHLKVQVKILFIKKTFTWTRVTTE